MLLSANKPSRQLSAEAGQLQFLSQFNARCECLAQQPQFSHLPGQAESLMLTYAQAEQLVLIALKAAEQEAAIEFS